MGANRFLKLILCLDTGWGESASFKEAEEFERSISLSSSVKRDLQGTEEPEAPSFLADLHLPVHWEIRWSKCLESSSVTPWLGTSSERCVLFIKWPSICRKLTRNVPPTAGSNRCVSTPAPEHQPPIRPESSPWSECTFLLGCSQAMRLLQSSERQAPFNFPYLIPVISTFRKLYIQKMDFRGNRKTLLVF